MNRPLARRSAGRAAGARLWGASRLISARAGALALLSLATLSLVPAGRAWAQDTFPGTSLSGASGSVTASNVTATGQSGEPTTYGFGALDSIWYSWTAPGNGDVTFQTCGGSTNFDTTLQTFTGSAVNALNQLATNDDSCGLQSVNTLAVTAGTTYRVQVDGYGSNTGTFELEWAFVAARPPAPTTTQACSALTGNWSGRSSTSGGISVDTQATNSGNATWNAAGTDAMNTIDGWSSASVQDQDSLVETFNWASTSDQGTYTFTFGKPVTNPVIHIDRIGGYTGSESNSSVWTLASPGTLYRLAGPSHFDTFADNSFNRTIGQVSANTSQSSLSPSGGTAPGSIMVEGTMSSLRFAVSGAQVGGGAAADAVEIVVCVPQADLELQTVVDTPAPTPGSTVTFTLTLTNDGPEAAPGVEVTGPLPAGLAFVSATPSQGSYDDATGIWDVGTVASGASPTLDIAATVTGTGTLTHAAEVTASGLVDPDSDPGDGSGDEFASSSLTVQAPNPVSCPAGSASDGFATGGSGAYRDEIYWLDWSCGGTTRFDPGDEVTKSWDAGKGLVITATLDNITAPIRPYDTGDWGGDTLDDLYSGINPIGLANATAGTDPQFDVSFAATLNGVPIDADIVVADAEDSSAAEEWLEWTSDGAGFQPIEATGVLEAAFSGGARTLRIEEPGNIGGGTLLALTEAVSTISVDMGAGGISATGFGVFLPFDHADADGFAAMSGHYLSVSASGGSQPSSATDVNALTLATLSHGGSLHLGSVRPDIEAADQPTSGADGDDTAGTDDEDGVTFPLLVRGRDTAIEVDVSQASASQGYLQGWFDWNGDGDFSDAGEQVASDLQSASAGASTISVPVTVPGAATTTPTFARFRWSTTQGLDASTAAPDGEVEDYQVQVLAPPALDFDADDSAGTTGADYATTFGGGNAIMLLTDTDVGITDADDTTLATGSTVTLSGFVDSGSEIVTIGGAVYTIGTQSVQTVSIGNTTFEIDSDGGDFQISVTAGTGEIADWVALFGDMTYQNTVSAPTPGLRTISFIVTDPSGVPSNPATTTISVGGKAVLAGAKSFVLVDGAAPGSTYALPGEDVVYTITVTNTGTGPTDPDTVFIVDPLPAEVIFFNGDIDTGGPDTHPGSDPVGFIDAGSGLSFTYSSDVGFAAGGTAPADFAACSYAPVPGYDPAVTHICFNPKGAMAAGDPDPAFSVSFRAGIR